MHNENHYRRIIQPLQTLYAKMDDTSVIDEEKQVYFLGLGWIEDNDEPNQASYAEETYENSNKIGSMGGG